MRNGSAELSKTPPQSKSTHRAKREIKRRVKPDARGLVGSRGKAPAELEAEPHSATADQAVQSVVRRISKSVIKQSSVGEQTLHRLYYILIQTHPAKSEAILRRQNFGVGDGVLDVPHPFACTFLRYPHHIWHIVSNHHTA